MDTILSRRMMGCEEPATACPSVLLGVRHRSGGEVANPPQISSPSPSPGMLALGQRVRVCDLGVKANTWRQTALRSDLYVHRPDFSSLILPHPQLSVFGWVHTLQELVHRLHRLKTFQQAAGFRIKTYFGHVSSEQVIPHVYLTQSTL